MPFGVISMKTQVPCQAAQILSLNLYIGSGMCEKIEVNGKVKAVIDLGRSTFAYG